MQIGVVFPQIEIGADAGAVRAYAAAVSDLGYRHVLAYDHVVGADPAAYRGWNGPYDIDDTFHEPLVLYGFLAGITSLELVTGILILPQRQTVLVAKQAAEVDLLTGGRFRLLRRLWTERSVTFEGRYDRVTGVGIAPLPAQRPIPVWFGASSPPALRRAGRLADGWFPQVRPGPKLDEAKRIVDKAAADTGREPGSLGMEGRVGVASRGPDEVAAAVQRWADAGATHVSVSTMAAGFTTVDQHIAALAAVSERVLR